MKKTKKESAFGERHTSKFSVGDLVKWKTWELTPKSPEMNKKDHVGVILDLYTEDRGGRKVAVAKVLNVNSQTTDDVISICLTLVSAAQANEQSM